MADVQDEPSSEGGVGVETAPESPRGVLHVIPLIVKGGHAVYKTVTIGGGLAADVEALWMIVRHGKRPPRCVNPKPKCGRRISAKAKFCPFCGTAQP